MHIIAAFFARHPTTSRCLRSLWILILFLLFSTTPVVAQINRGVVTEIRAIYPSEWNVPYPAGIAYAAEAVQFFLLDKPSAGASAATGVTIVTITPYEEMVNSVHIPFAVDDAMNMAFDDGSQRLLLLNVVRTELAQVAMGANGMLDPATLVTSTVASLGLGNVQGMAIDSAARRLFLLGRGVVSNTTQVLNIGLDLAGGLILTDVTTIDLAHLADPGLRGLAVHPLTHHLYLASQTTPQLYEITLTGEWLTSYALADLGLVDGGGLVFAPSADLTDAPATTHLFIADSHWRRQVEDSPVTAAMNSARAIAMERLYLPLVAQGEAAGRAAQTSAQLYGAILEVALHCAECNHVTATAETDPVPNANDAADDPAIWINPLDPNRSTVIGTDKRGGLAVYDLAGHQLQYLPDGFINNVDLRHDFPLGEQQVTLVAANNRTSQTLALYQVDPTTRLLSAVAARPIPLAMNRLSGVCMYHSPITDKYYAITNNKFGQVVQWELFATGQGQVDATVVRTFAMGVQVEGCVADDELAQLYIAAEDVGIWKYDAEPDTAATGRLIDTVDATGHLHADVEGLTLYYANSETEAGLGYLIASSQGSKEFVVYQRGGANAYVTRFSIVAGNGIDEVSGTDGIDVTSVALGAAFPQGLFVAQDGNNGDENQNFKLVSWSRIAGIANPPLLIDPPVWP